MKKNLEKIAGEDGRFSLQAVKFVYSVLRSSAAAKDEEGLGYAVKKMTAKPGHVSGQILCKSLSRLAIKKWGRLAMLVLNSWGIKTTRDFGEIVYLMIKHKWMSAQPTDSIEDFNDVYAFETIFKDQFKF